MTPPRFTMIGGPTVLIEIPGLRLLTDPTFDPPGEYQLPHVKLIKTAGPAIPAERLGKIDAVLLSHDQHADNLYHSGRALLAQAGRVLTTVAGAHRLSGQAEGLAPWQSAELDEGRARVTATPARHGPAGIEPLAGDVIGFVIEARNTPAIYVTGDTVWYDGVAEVSRRFKVGIVLLFAGAAQTRGPFHLTMDVNDAIETAQAFPEAAIVPAHCGGWQHFRQSCDDVAKSFNALGFGARLRVLEPGVATEIAPQAAKA